LNGYVFHPNSFEFKTILNLIDNVSNGMISGAVISRHIKPNDNLKYYFCYAVSKKSCYEDTRSILDIESYYIFKNNVISDFIKKFYKNLTIIVTKTKNLKSGSSWCTVSCLININKLRAMVENQNYIMCKDFL